MNRHLSQFLLLLFCFNASAHAAERPNVLLILVDDLKPTLGCYGDSVAKTPNMDQLAKRGMQFDLAYCNQAVCAPSRFTLMLGSHSTSTGLYGLGSQLRQLIPDAVTMPQYFAKHGYRTESLGKVFHIGHGNYGDPESFTVPHFKEKVIEYVDPASTPGGQLTREEAMFQNVAAPPGGMNSLPRGAAFESPDVADDAYADGRVAAETVRRLQAAKDREQPFFIVAGFARPHLPFSAPKKYWDLYDPADFEFATNSEIPANSPSVAHKRGGEIRNYFPVPDKQDPAEIDESIARKLIHGYYASTSFVDAQIGKVIDELDRLNLADNTIIVLWGDHGFHLGDHGIWTKHTNYEQANRIPLLIAAPGVTQPNSSTKQLAESVDVFPTLAELAGLPALSGPQPVDGKSLVPVLRDSMVRVRDHAYHVYPNAKLGRAIRTERYRLVEWKKIGDAPQSAELELYDYEADPHETRNLAASESDTVKKLLAILATYPEPMDGRLSRRESAIRERPDAERKSAIIDSQPNNESRLMALAAHDRAVHVLDDWIRDPYIVLGPDGWFYLTGTTQSPDLQPTSESKYNTGLGETSLVGWHARVWRSRDLAEWESLGSPFTLQDGIWASTRPKAFTDTPREQWRLWAPELHWLGDRWALIHTSPAPVRGANLSLTAGRDVKGPWTNPLGTTIERRHDPSLFRHDDGTWWMIWGATQIAPLKADFTGFTAEPSTISPTGDFAKMGHEGCLIQKIGGQYVLFGTGWSTGEMRKGSYNLYYATADRITGPYSERKFVGRFLGHGTPFRDSEDRWWCTAFYNGNIPPLSREGIESRDLSADAQTINEQGVTLVPLEVTIDNGRLVNIHVKDPAYATPGPDEKQPFAR
jgi:iduronate 2-sulfatase